MKKKCEICDKLFEKPLKQSIKYFMEQRKYCSRECYKIGWRKKMIGHRPFNTPNGIKKQSETMKKLYRDGKIKPWNKGIAQNPNSINPNTGRNRAKSWFPNPKPCRICGKKAERHHIDNNPMNNNSDNIDWLCRKHHMKKHDIWKYHRKTKEEKNKKVICEYCGKKFWKLRSELKRSNHNFCSRDCGLKDIHRKRDEKGRFC